MSKVQRRIPLPLKQSKPGFAPVVVFLPASAATHPILPASKSNTPGAPGTPTYPGAPRSVRHSPTVVVGSPACRRNGDPRTLSVRVRASTRGGSTSFNNDSSEETPLEAGFGRPAEIRLIRETLTATPTPSPPPSNKYPNPDPKSDLRNLRRGDHPLEISFQLPLAAPRRLIRFQH